MRIGLIGYFDLGESYGLSDEVFPASDREPDIGLVGIDSPLGQGVLLDLLVDEPAAVSSWRTAAAELVTRPVMETGWSQELDLSRQEFDQTLIRLISDHSIARCQLRIHAVGTVYAELHFGIGIPLTYVEGVLNCFEYAAYRSAVANTLLRAARRRVERALGPKLTGLAELSRRDLPAERRDATGHAERRLFTSFTRLIACVDEADERLLPALTEAMRLNDDDIIDFEYHGRLHYGWATCVLEPMTWAQDVSFDSAEAQITRMEADIRLAHVFLGTSEAYAALFVSELRHQVEGPGPARSAAELNRMRTLALAVVSLTDFDRVTSTYEDQAFFRKFSEDALLKSKHETIRESAEVLYNVETPAAATEAKQVQWLSTVVGLFALLTLISVSIDAYNFIRADDSLIEVRAHRIFLLLGEFVLLAVFIYGLAYRRNPWLRAHRER